MGERKRISLPPAIFETTVRGQQDYTGIWITGLYYGPRSGRMFSRTYSIWDDGRGACIGTQYDELDESNFLAYCDKTGTDVPTGIGAEKVE